MKIHYLIIFMILCNFAYTQEKSGELNFEFSHSVNSYSMENLNEFYIDSFAMKPNINLMQNHIKRGQLFRLGLSYKPTGLFDFGIYGSYQYGNSKSTPIATETDEFGWPVQEHEGNFELRTEAISLGINTNWYMSHLLKFQEKESPLNRFHFGVQLNGGVGFSKAIADLRYPTYSIASFYDFLNSRDFQGQVALRVEYDFTKSPICTTVGFSFGYQFFRTNTLKDRLEKNWEVLGQFPVNLDFSGLFLGMYIVIGK